MKDDRKEASPEELARNLKLIRGKITASAAKAGRQPSDIKLVAVSKTFSTETTAWAAKIGVTDLGESRVQEGSAKIAELGPIARWHMIGHLQKNKAKLAVSCFDMIHSLDSYRLAQKVSDAALGFDRKIDCLIEVNCSGELAKFGYDFDQLLSEADKISKLHGIKLCGLMTIGPNTDDTGELKKAFDKTYNTYEVMRQNLGAQINVLSMGMSHDFQLAIECGSNMVRIGTAIFGRRA